MLVFATSDKGGTGRSVTSANVAYRRALHGDDVCYLDFDFGSPTSAAVFDVPTALRGADHSGLHSYLRGECAEPRRVDVWGESESPALRRRPAGSGQLVLLPGDRGGGEFVLGPDTPRRCAELFLRLEEEFEIVLVDLSAGRSYAAQLVLEATSLPELAGLTARWLVFHRWTRQHIIAAAGLVYGERGIMATATSRGHDAASMRDSVRFVRAAVPDVRSPMFTDLRPAQAQWLSICDEELNRLAAQHRLGPTLTLGKVPLDPVLQWREQLITDDDVLLHQVANVETAQAFADLAVALTDHRRWQSPL
ncbi:SCO2523 family variant P-loop protein [Kitasatospora viridis]|uniref:MinD-like ATPase involved in chromosome partitioning or flagellar assembly n=1 Tax=Kitasatospora viridis TaxID=281105 RepID=A0A561UG79_9ACTN|nr:SCO2523 family variant P-loop protein [Kitasatospora viridis]TWF98369.1 MinD-like ATPase involved in chromosome partitioning or flagellar assembly [Kitasatospora viridis]